MPMPKPSSPANLIIDITYFGLQSPTKDPSFLAMLYWHNDGLPYEARDARASSLSGGRRAGRFCVLHFVGTHNAASGDSEYGGRGLRFSYF